MQHVREHGNLPLTAHAPTPDCVAEEAAEVARDLAARVTWRVEDADVDARAPENAVLAPEHWYATQPR